MANPILLAGFKAALDAETNPTNPLSTVDPSSIDEFLSRINDDFAEGRFVLEPERLLRLANSYRAEAMNWEMEQAAEKKRAPRGKKADPKNVLDTSDFQF
jgi:hypothetical protein